MISKPIPYGRQHITDEDIRAVIDTLKSDYLTQGPKIKEFETKFAEYVGAQYAVAVNNATSGLHLAATALKPFTLQTDRKMNSTGSSPGFSYAPD